MPRVKNFLKPSIEDCDSDLIIIEGKGFFVLSPTLKYTVNKGMKGKHIIKLNIL